MFHHVVDAPYLPTEPLERLAEWIASFDPETKTFAVKGFIEPFEDDPDREMPDRG